MDLMDFNGIEWDFNGIYPPVIQHGMLENGPFIGNFPMNTSIKFGDFPAGHVSLLRG